MSEPESTRPRAWYEEHRALYLSSGGAEGHLYDFTPINGEGLTPNCLIKHVGRKSGRTLILPLIYGLIGGEIAIVASKGGAPQHPAWYLNIKAASEVEVQIATNAFRATWREPQDAERRRAWDVMVAIYAPYAEYQQKTDREIPIVLMKPVAPVAVFTEAELDG